MPKLIETLHNDFEKDLYRQLGRFCAYRERAESELWKKLNSLEIEEELSYKLIQLLKKDKFLDNKRFAIAYTQGKFLNNKWGRIKIRSGLVEKKISPDFIAFAFKKIDEEFYTETINNLIDKKAKTLKGKEQLFVFRKKIVDFVRSKGYEVEIVWDLVKAKFPR